MRVYKVIGKYTGVEVLAVFANTMQGAKCWFTRNARMGLSSSYVFIEFIGRDERVVAPKLTLEFKPVAYAGLFYVYINGSYVALAGFDSMDMAKDGKLVDFPAGFEYMLTELLDHKYDVVKSTTPGVYNVMSLHDHKLVGKIVISENLKSIQYYPISEK